MKLEKNFYTEDAKLWRKIEQEEEEHRALLPPEQLEEEKEEIVRGAKEIEEKVQAMQKNRYEIIRQERLNRFQNLVQKALAIAEAAPMDIMVDTEHYSGQIRMKADCLLILPSSPAGMREDLETLIREAESVSIAPTENGLIELSFVYPFCSEIPKTGGTL